MHASALHLVFFTLIVLGLIAISFFRNSLFQMSLILIFFSVGFLSFYLEVQKQGNKPIYETQQTVIARVTSVNNYTYSQRVFLQDVYIGGQKSDNITLFITNGAVEISDRITFDAILTKIELFELGEFSSYYYLNKIVYSAKINQSQITNSEKTPFTLQEQIRQSVQSVLNSFMSQESADLAYSSLFGDRTNLDYEISSAFSTSGIAHVLSVSGMHVAFLVLLVNLLLKKFKLNSKIRLLIFALILGFYCYLCNFNTTVVRATIMSLVILSASAFGKQHDILNALGLAGFLILAINPLSAFDVGFQLSFLSVLIIAMFSKATTRFFMANHLPKFIAAPLAITLSVQLGILPIIAKYFGQISILSVFTNLLAIPIFQIAYMLNFIMVFVVMLLPFLGFILTFVSFLYQYVIFLANHFANIEWATIQLFVLDDIAIILFYLALFVVSSYFMIKFKYKLLMFSFILILSFSFSALNAAPTHYKNLNIMQINTSLGTQTLIIDQNEKTTLIGDLNDLNYISLFLKKAKINKIDHVIKTEQNASYDFYDFARHYGVTYIYQPQQTVENENLSISYIDISNNQSVVLLDIGGHNVLYFNKQLNSTQKIILNNALQFVNVNITINSDISSYEMLADYIVKANSLENLGNNYTSLNNWRFEIKNGKLEKIGSFNWNLLK